MNNKNTAPLKSSLLVIPCFPFFKFIHTYKHSFTAQTLQPYPWCWFFFFSLLSSVNLQFQQRLFLLETNAVLKYSFSSWKLLFISVQSASRNWNIFWWIFSSIIIIAIHHLWGNITGPENNNKLAIASHFEEGDGWCGELGVHGVQRESTHFF